MQDATVAISGDNDSGFTVTDVNGHYQINSGISIESYTVTVIQPGYLINDSISINVTSGQTLTLDVFLHKSGAVSSNVTDSSGNPIKNTYVFVQLSNGSSAYGYYDVTDSSSNYAIYTNLETSSYNITAGFLAKGYVPVQATASITAGQQTSNVNLVLQTSGKITGKITYPNGTAAANVYVYAITGR